METAEETVRRAMSILGSIKTPKKAAAARANGRKPKRKRTDSKTNANGSEIVSNSENKVSE